VVKATGVKTTTNQKQLIELIKNAGKTPVKRDSLYKVLQKF